MSNFDRAVQAAVEAHWARKCGTEAAEGAAINRFALALCAVIMEGAQNGCSVGGIRHLTERDLPAAIDAAVRDRRQERAV